MTQTPGKAANTRVRGWQCTGSKWKGRCTTPGRRPAIAASSVTCRRQRLKHNAIGWRSFRKIRRPTPSGSSANFARRAFRRPRDRGRSQAFLALVNDRLAEKDTFEQAVRVGLTGILSSPRFLFLDEKPGKLDDFALASRLSYFFWSTMPDDELLTLAERKKLSQPDVLREQVERMLQDPKAAAFTNFCGQWLNLRDIEATDTAYRAVPGIRQDAAGVDGQRGGAVLHRAAEERPEPDQFRGVRLFDAQRPAGAALRHPRRGRLVGVPQRRRCLPTAIAAASLTMAGVLKVTANGTNTSPGQARRLGAGTDPGHAAAAAAGRRAASGAGHSRRHDPPRTTGETSQQSPPAPRCHAKIDPPGFALESFDAIGGWREYYRAEQLGGRHAKEVKGKHYLQGPDVDATGETADGRTLQNIDEFKQLLLRDKDQMARALTEKLVTYATGGVPEAADKPEIEAIVAKIRDKNYGLRTLVHEIVQSKMFQDRSRKLNLSRGISHDLEPTRDSCERCRRVAGAALARCARCRTALAAAPAARAAAWCA